MTHARTCAHQPLNTIDLFSGIGGISYALRDIVRPLLYCDIDPNAQRVLKARMRSGHLQTAPIVDDVRQGGVIGQHVSGQAVDLVISSSSCVGFSWAGDKQGLENPETGMMVETMRLIDRFRPSMVFMENVPGIRTVNGGADLRQITQIFKDIGYVLHHDLFSARDVGAWHMRKRWFCLAARIGAPKPDILAACSELEAPRLQPWNDTGASPSQMTIEGTRAKRARMHMLGNSVVPACVRHAFFTLAQRAFDFSVTLSTGVVVRKPRDLRIEIDPHKPGLPVPNRQGKATSGLMTDKKMLRQYPTPRAQNSSASGRLTVRCSQDLCTVVKFQTGVPWTYGSMVNPQFIEFLMGFPTDFTLVEDGA